VAQSVHRPIVRFSTMHALDKATALGMLRAVVAVRSAVREVSGRLDEADKLIASSLTSIEKWRGLFTEISTTDSKVGKKSATKDRRSRVTYGCICAKVLNSPTKFLL